MHTAIFSIPSNDLIPDVLAAHARHIFDWSTLHASQYYSLMNEFGYISFGFTTFSPNTSKEDAHEAIQPLVRAIQSAGGKILIQDSYEERSVNVLWRTDETAGFNAVAGSRLVPSTAYEDHPEAIGSAHKELLD